MGGDLPCWHVRSLVLILGVLNIDDFVGSRWLVLCYIPRKKYSIYSSDYRVAAVKLCFGCVRNIHLLISTRFNVQT